VVPSRPKKAITIRAIPPCGNEWPRPAMLIASTGACTDVEPYRVRVQLGCGVSVSTGVWLTPCTLVHCLICSPKFG
jgi:hypothetical protein